MTLTGAAVTIRDLAKSFGDHRVFSDVSLDVASGSVTAIVGPSGGGKSTLLRTINRLEEPDAGTVQIGGTVYTAGSPLDGRQARELHRSVGMVFQQFNLFPHLSALRNVAFAQQYVLGRSRANAELVARDLLAKVGLADRAEQHPQRLSGGQQQRVAIARALALGPEVMLFDEPTSALDPEIAEEVLAVIRTLAAEGMTTIIVTHDLRFARELADQVVVVADGTIIERGDPQRVIDRPEHPRTVRFLGAVLGR